MIEDIATRKREISFLRELVSGLGAIGTNRVGPRFRAHSLLGDLEKHGGGLVVSWIWRRNFSFVLIEMVQSVEVEQEMHEALRIRF